MTNLLVPILNRDALGFPLHQDSRGDYDRAVYVPLSVALTQRFEYDAHFAAYSLPRIERRLASVGALALEPTMVLFLVDVEPVGHAPVTTEWWEAEHAKLMRLLGDHPGAFIYRTRGGYRIVYRLATPYTLKDRGDAETWRASYLAWTGYLLDTYEIDADTSCQDWSRVMRSVFVLRDGEAQEPEIIGDPDNVGTWDVPYADKVAVSDVTTLSVPEVNTANLDIDRVSAAAQALAGAWPTAATGGRHQAHLHLSGALARAGWDIDTIAEFLYTVAELAEPGVGKMDERKKIARASVNGIAEGKPITGWTRLEDVVDPGAVLEARQALGMSVPQRAPGFLETMTALATTAGPTDAFVHSTLEATKTRLRRSTKPEIKYDGDLIAKVLGAELILEVREVCEAAVALLRNAPVGTTDGQIIKLLMGSAAGRAAELPQLLAAARGYLQPPVAADDGDKGHQDNEPQTDDEIRAMLIAGEKDPIRACGSNIELILRYSQMLRGKLRFNELTKSVEIPGTTFQKENPNSLDVAIKNWLEIEWGMFPQTSLVGEQLLRTARMYGSYDPVKEYLLSLTWDGVPRIDTWLTDYCGTPDEVHARWFSSKFLIAAVARALNPGCKVDTMLVLEGGQGIGKSTVLKTLGGAWFSDTPMVLGDKDSRLLAASKWIIEMAELASLSGRDVEAHKAFLSSAQDDFRPPYGRATETFQRHCVFAGTTNDYEYLKDPTGNRRYWPAVLSRADIDKLTADRDQLWAEAVVRYQHSTAYAPHNCPAEFRWWLSFEEQLIVNDIVDARVSEDPWASMVVGWFARQSMPGGPPPKTKYTLAEIGNGALSMSTADLSRYSKRLGELLRKLGYDQVRLNEGRNKITYWVRKPPTAAELAAAAATAPN